MLLLLILFGLVVYYFYSIRNFVYFSKHNIKHDRPLPIFGNHFKVFFGKRTDTEMTTYLYNKYREEKLVGYYRGETPEIIVRDPDLIKNILNTNFLEFSKRGGKRDSKIEPLMLNMFSEEGNAWKLLRSNLSPAFSSSKIKNMFPIIADCADKLVNIAHQLAVEEKEFDASNLCARFTIDVIGACGFGIDMKSLNNEHSLFMKLRDIIFKKSKWQIFLFGIYDIFPNSFINRVQLARPQIRQMIKDILNSVQRQRRDDTTLHNDFISLLLELGKVRKLYGDTLEMNKNGQYQQTEIEFDENRMIAQLYIFFVAGFETSSNTMSYAMHELAYNSEIQREVQEEIDKALAKYNNKLCYESVSEMFLLEMVVKEGLRLFPPGGITTRICTKDYKIPGINLTIEPGTKVIIPIHALHMDSTHFENPHKFNPRRFSQEKSQSHQKYAYLPFGEGPRKCIGARLGTLEAMAGLAALLHNFTIETSPSSTKNIRLNRASYMVQFVDGGLPLRLTLRDNTTSRIKNNS